MVTLKQSQTIRKNKRLKSGRCFLIDFFDEKDLDLFETMAIICIRSKSAHDKINLNHMRNLYKRLKCLCLPEN